MGRSATKTKSHDKIREWAEARDGSPATVKHTEQDDEAAGILRIDFPGYTGEDSLEHIEWDEFFDKFDEANLIFLYQEKTKEGNTSRFCKFVRRPEGVLSTIQSQHDEILDLLDKASETSDNAVKTRQDLAQKIRTKLSEHMEAEEATFYPRLVDEAGIEGEILESEEEHYHTRSALDRLADVDAGSVDWHSRLKVLRELVEHHIEEEEDDTFEIALDTFDQEENEQLNQAFTKIAS